MTNKIDSNDVLDLVPVENIIEYIVDHYSTYAGIELISFMRDIAKEYLTVQEILDQLDQDDVVDWVEDKLGREIN